MSDDTKYLSYGPSNVGDLLATTLSKWASENLEDQIFNAMPLYKKMYAKAKKQNGGATILLPVMYEKNNTVGWYSKYDSLDTTPQNGFTLTQGKWKNLSGSVSISGDDLAKNSGEAQIISLLDSYTMQAMESMRDEVSTSLFRTAPGSTQMTSLVTMIDATSTIQEVNSTNNSWWQSTVTSGGSFAAQGLDDMRTTRDTVEEYNPVSTIDTIVTTKAIKNYYEASLTPNIRYTPGGDGKPTFSSLMFGNAEIFSDPSATSGVIYMFSTDDLSLYINTNGEYRTTEFVKPSNQDAKVAQIILRVELLTRARRKLAKISSVTA